METQIFRPLAVPREGVGGGVFTGLGVVQLRPTGTGVDRPLGAGELNDRRRSNLPLLIDGDRDVAGNLTLGDDRGGLTGGLW